jgi:hypothetical protein
MSLDGYYIIPSFDVSIVEPKFINLLVWSCATWEREGVEC